MWVAFLIVWIIWWKWLVTQLTNMGHLHLPTFHHNQPALHIWALALLHVCQKVLFALSFGILILFFKFAVLFFWLITIAWHCHSVVIRNGVCIVFWCWRSHNKALGSVCWCSWHVLTYCYVSTCWHFVASLLHHHQKSSLHPLSASKATQKGVGWCWLVKKKWFELFLCYDSFTMHHIGIMQWQISLCFPTHWLCIMLICNIFKNGVCIIFWHQRQCKKAFGGIDCQGRNGLNWDFVLSSKNGVHIIIWWHHHRFMPIGCIPVDT